MRNHLQDILLPVSRFVFDVHAAADVEVMFAGNQFRGQGSS
jgi:hypothetical protein